MKMAQNIKNTTENKEVNVLDIVKIKNLKINPEQSCYVRFFRPKYKDVFTVHQIYWISKMDGICCLKAINMLKGKSLGSVKLKKDIYTEIFRKRTEILQEEINKLINSDNKTKSEFFLKKDKKTYFEAKDFPKMSTDGLINILENNEFVITDQNIIQKKNIVQTSIYAYIWTLNFLLRTNSISVSQESEVDENQKQVIKSIIFRNLNNHAHSIADLIALTFDKSKINIFYGYDSLILFRQVDDNQNISKLNTYFDSMYKFLKLLCSKTYNYKNVQKKYDTFIDQISEGDKVYVIKDEEQQY